MALTKYTYSKDANITVLTDEVLADVGITTSLNHIDLDELPGPDTVDIWFVNAISGAEETALDAVVAAHTNPTVPTAFICHTGAGAPGIYLGADGDVCVDPDTMVLYKKVAGAWGSSKSIDGTPPLNTLSDVIFTTPAAGEILKFDGTDWINNTLAEAGIVATSHTHVEADITDLQAYLLNITGESFTALSDTPGAFGGHNSKFAKVNATGTALEFSTFVGPIDDLDDVSITSVATNELLQWSGTAWVNRTLAQAGVAAETHTHLEADITDLQAYLLNITGENFTDLADVTITGIGAGELVKWTGTGWINNTLAQAGIAPIVHTHVEADITDLQAYLLNINAASIDDLSDVNIASVVAGETLKFDGTHWINNTLVQAGIAAAVHTHLEADITDLQAYLLYADFDTQQQGANTNANTTSTSYVDPSFMDVTTSNTRNLDYTVIANFEVSVSLAATTATFRLVEDGTIIANSERTIILDDTESPTVVTLIGYEANVPTAKVIKVQMKTDKGTLTMGNRSLIIQGRG